MKNHKKYLGKVMSLVLAGALTMTGVSAEYPLAVQAAGTNYYVSVTGNDANKGTIDAPFRTIQKATEVMAPGDTCYVREGIYDEAVKPAVNGTAGAPITIKNYNGESVTLSGCDRLTGWVATDEVGIWKAPMNWSLGDNGDENQVFVNGELMYEARYPNVAEGSTLTNFNFAKTGTGTGFVGSTTVPRGEQSKLVDPAFKEFALTDDFFDGARIWMVPGSEWTALTSDVISYDASTGTVIFESTYRGINNKGGYYNPGPNKPYYIFGSKKLLDAENEWWYSKDEQMLYVKIKDGKNPDEAGAYLEAKKRSVGLDLSGCSYINIDGINMRGTTLITDETSSNLQLSNMKCEYVGHKSSIGFESLTDNSSPQDDLGFLIKGHHISISGCEISNSSGPVINLQGSDNSLTNCYIHDGNYIGTYAGHSKLSGRRQFISNNTMCESGRDVVSFRNLSESVVQYNDIYGAGRLTKDVGIMYAAETDGQNTQIHHNRIHDNYTPSNINGLYLDEMSHNFIVYRNVIWDGGNTFCLNHTSMYNLVYNNTGWNKTTVGDTYTATFKDERGRQYMNNHISGKSNAAFSPVKTYYYNNQAPTGAGFADTASHDFRISSDSPLAGAGIAISGVTGSNPSIGAYEPGEDFVVGHNFENPPVILPAPDVTQFEYRNLVKNGGFEYGNLESWTSAGTLEVRFDSAWHSTKQVAATCMYGVIMQPGAVLTQTIPVEKSSEYTVALLSRAPQASNIKISVLGTYGAEIASQEYAVSGTTWAPATQKSLTFEATADTVTISITNNGANELYLDDVGMQKNVATVGDISQPITFTYDKTDYHMSLQFNELAEGHSYFAYADNSQDTKITKGMPVPEKPERYLQEIKSGDKLECYPKQYINVAEVVNNKVVGVYSEEVIGQGLAENALLEDTVISMASKDVNLDSTTLTDGSKGTDYLWINGTTTSDKTYALLKFDITDIDQKNLKSAVLRFYIDHGNANNTSTYRRIQAMPVNASDWKEGELTWQQALDSSLINTTSAIGYIQLPKETNEYLCEIDVTKYLQEKAKEYALQKEAGTADNKVSIALRFQSSYRNGDVYIVSKDNADAAKAGLKPALVISEYLKIPTVCSVGELEGITVGAGTPAEELPLPETVGVTLETGNLAEAQIAWNTEDYQPDVEGEQTLQGTLILPEDILNVQSMMAEIKVTVINIPVTGVELEHESLTVSCGDAVELQARIQPENATNKNVTWESSNVDVATVENGIVTTVSCGDAVITVTTEDGGYQDSCTITVDTNEIPVQSVSMGDAQIELVEGEEYTLDVQVSPENAANRAVNWKSSDESVATVVNGHVKAIKEGTATITAITVDGGYTASCTVTVKSAKVSVTGVSLNYIAATLKEGENFLLQATITPENATEQEVIWSSSDNRIANVYRGNVAAVNEGTAVITVTTVDGGFTASCNITVTKEDIPVDPVEPVDPVDPDDSEDSDNSGAGSSWSADVDPEVDWRVVKDNISAMPGKGAAQETPLNVLTGRNMVVPGDVFDALKERKGTLALQTGRGAALSVEAYRVTENLVRSGLNLTVEFDTNRIPEALYKEYTKEALEAKQISIDSKTPFDMVLDLHVSLKKENAGKYANMYSFNAQTGKMEYRGCFKITENGQAMFAITGGGDYLVTVTQKPQGTVNNASGYIVQSGDTLSGIAFKHKMRLAEIIAINPQISNPDRIRVGQRIKVK